MSKKKKQFAAKGRAKLTKALTMVKASVKEARAGLIPSEETDAQIPLPGPLELLEREGLSDHCEMCGNQEKCASLEPAFDPSGQPKTLCRECRIGSAELLANKRLDDRDLATVLAALRYWQRAIGVDSLPVGPMAKSEYMLHFNFSGDEEDQCLPLGTDEIDALCERINA
jgi:hypothetical protein